MRKTVKYFDILNKLIQDEQKLKGTEFVSPVSNSNKARLLADGIFTEFKLKEKISGWWVFKVKNMQNAEIIREANIPEIKEYAKNFKKCALILLIQDKFGQWIAYDISKNKIVIVFLVEGALSFDNISSVYDGANYWFISINRNSDIKKPSYLREYLNLNIPNNPNLSFKDKLIFEAAYNLKENIHMDSELIKIVHALQTGNAKLLSYQKTDNGYIIKWEKGSHIYSSNVDEKLSVKTAGFCISGKDKEHDLTSLSSLAKNR